MAVDVDYWRGTKVTVINLGGLVVRCRPGQEGYEVTVNGKPVKCRRLSVVIDEDWLPKVSIDYFDDPPGA